MEGRISSLKYAIAVRGREMTSITVCPQTIRYYPRVLHNEILQSMKLSGLTPAKVYFFQVRSINARGFSSELSRPALSVGTLSEDGVDVVLISSVNRIRCPRHIIFQETAATNYFILLLIVIVLLACMNCCVRYFKRQRKEKREYKGYHMKIYNSLLFRKN